MDGEINFGKDQCLLKYVSKEELESMTKKIKEMFLTMTPVREWKGHVFLPGFSPEITEQAHNNYEPTKDDVFIVSYPKTGTNWTGEVIRQILFQNEEEAKVSKAIPKTLLETPPNDKRAFYDKFQLKRYLIASHLPAQLVNVERIKKAQAKVVYVLRNPKDQLVSMYNFFRSITPGQVEPLKTYLFSGWDKYFDHAVAGDLPTATKPGEWYPEHILSWYPYRDNKTVYFLYFENMKKNLCKEIKLLSEFLEAPMTDQKAAEIAKACSFGEMKREMASGNHIQAKQLAINMRKGHVGGWKDYLTVRQSEIIDQIFEEKLQETDIKFAYEL